MHIFAVFQRPAFHSSFITSVLFSCSVREIQSVGLEQVQGSQIECQRWIWERELTNDHHWEWLFTYVGRSKENRHPLSNSPRVWEILLCERRYPGVIQTWSALPVMNMSMNNWGERKSHAFHCQQFWSPHMTLKIHHAVPLTWMSICEGDELMVWLVSVFTWMTMLPFIWIQRNCNFLIKDFTRLYISCAQSHHVQRHATPKVQQTVGDSVLLPQWI